MSKTTTKQKPAASVADSKAASDQPIALAQIAGMPAVASEYGITAFEWQTLTTSIYPGAKPESILSAVAYCRARKLDVLKKPVHIVPMRVSVKQADGKSRDEWRDVIMPGINELRTTAMRTGEYAGHSKPEFGPVVEVYGAAVPEYCDVVVYRMMRGERCEFPHREYFREACATKRDSDTGRVYLNAMWSRRPIGQLTKCAIAGALRDAFPEEIGNEYAAEEMHGKLIDAEHQTIEDEHGATPGADFGESGPLTDGELNARVSDRAPPPKPPATHTPTDAAEAGTGGQTAPAKDWPHGEGAGQRAAAAVSAQRQPETFDNDEAPPAAEAPAVTLDAVMALIDAGLDTSVKREHAASMLNKLPPKDRITAGRALAKAISNGTRPQ